MHETLVLFGLFWFLADPILRVLWVLWILSTGREKRPNFVWSRPPLVLRSTIQYLEVLLLARDCRYSLKNTTKDFHLLKILNGPRKFWKKMAIVANSFEAHGAQENLNFSFASVQLSTNYTFLKSTWRWCRLHSTPFLWNPFSEMVHLHPTNEQ